MEKRTDKLRNILRGMTKVKNMYTLIRRICDLSKSILFFTFGLFILTLSSGCHARYADQPMAVKTSLKIGEELKLCTNCPVFVRVPDAQRPLRQINYVSKFELTWNNYLASYNDGACKIPRYANKLEDVSLQIIAENVDEFYIDWPVSELGPTEVDCYVRWLQKKTAYLLALPTAPEWEWFARAGRKDVKYPWGNSPAGGDEVLYDRKGGRLDPRFQDPVPENRGGEFVSAMKVGQSSPNPWGLYDIMGNAQEITSTVISGVEWDRIHPGSTYMRGIERVLVKGTDSFYGGDWSSSGISESAYVQVLNAHYSSPVAIRLVLIERNK